MLSVELKEIPQNGQSFEFSRQNKILNKTLKPLIGSEEYEVKIYINPMANIYEITGEITTQIPLICSRCAKDLKKTITKKVNEVLFVMNEKPDIQQKSLKRTSFSEESQLFCHIIDDDTFNLGDYIYEQLAVSLPERPLGEDSKACDEGQCPNFIKFQKESSFKGNIEPHLGSLNPFSALSEWSSSQ